MGILATASDAAARALAQQRVVIVGAGPSGMATAIELAQRGIRSTVLEARGPVGSREPLFNVLPAFADRLAALDPSGSLTSHLVPTSGIDARMYRTLEDARNPNIPGARLLREYDGALSPNGSRSRGDIEAVTSALLDPQRHRNADTRTWSKVGIGELDTALRQVADSPQLRDMIEVRYNTPVAGIRQGDGWAEAILKEDPNTGAADAVRGVLLVDASGINLLGSPFRIHPEQMHWVGAKFQPGADAKAGAAMPIHRAYTPGLTHEDRTVTVALPTRDRTIVWAETTGERGADTPEQQLALITERARLAGINEPLAADAKPWRVDVQLAYTTQAADRRVLAVGNSVRAPYFMTSTGAATAVVHDAPQAVDAIVDVMKHGADPAVVAARYDQQIQHANEALHVPVGKMQLQDAGVRAADAGAAQIGQWPQRR